MFKSLKVVAPVPEFIKTEPKLTCNLKEGFVIPIPTLLPL
jgi:hypothetical protein